MSLFSKRRRRRSSTASAATATSSRRRRRRGKLPLVLPVAAAVAVLLVVVFAVRGVSGARQKAQVEDVVSELRYACNNLDTNALLDLIDPSVADPLRLVALAAGADKTAVLEQIVYALNDGLENIDLERALRSLTMEVKEVQIKKPEALVVAACTIDVEGETFVRDAYLYLQSIQGKWYIIDMDLDLSLDW